MPERCCACRKFTLLGGGTMAVMCEKDRDHDGSHEVVVRQPGTPLPSMHIQWKGE